MTEEVDLKYKVEPKIGGKKSHQFLRSQEDRNREHKKFCIKSNLGRKPF